MVIVVLIKSQFVTDISSVQVAGINLKLLFVSFCCCKSKTYIEIRVFARKVYIALAIAAHYNSTQIEKHTAPLMWHTVSHHPEHTCTWTRIHATIFELCSGGCLHWASVPHCVSHVPVMLALWAAPSSVRQRLIACSWLAIRGPIRWSDGSPRCGELPSRWIANRQSTTVEEQWNHFNFSLMARSPIRSGTPREATRSGFRNKKTPLAVLV